MKKAIGLIGFIISFLAVSINAQGISPNEVRVFRHPDFMGDSATYILQDEMRHKLVASLGDLDNSISSILIGSDVAVMVFSESGFNNILPGVLYNGKMLFPEKMSLKGFSGEWNDSISSLVVFRMRDFGQMRYNRDPWGIYLLVSSALKKQGHNWIRFIPLPESQKEIEARHALLGVEWDNKTDYVFLHRQLEVTLYDLPKFQGNPLHLPGAAPEKLSSSVGEPNVLHFALGKYDFSEKASSLIAKIRGAVPPPPERGTQGETAGTTHRAPPAGGASKPVPMKLGTIKLEPINIAGTWKSNIGLVYEIAQSKDKFTWKVINLKQEGEGTITGDSISATWVDPKGRGGAKGKIILNEKGKSVKIQWSNGVVFTK
jgi:hypothetical protein